MSHLILVQERHATLLNYQELLQCSVNSWKNAVRGTDISLEISWSMRLLIPSGPIALSAGSAFKVVSTSSGVRVREQKVSLTGYGMSGSSAFSSFSRVWSLKKSFSMLAFSVSSAYTVPSFSSGGIEELDLDEMNGFRMDHHCLEDRLLDFNFSARWSFNACLDFRIADITLLRYCLNLCQSDGFCVLFALR